jgi:hypothetical protein
VLLAASACDPATFAFDREAEGIDGGDAGHRRADDADDDSDASSQVPDAPIDSAVSEAATPEASPEAASPEASVCSIDGDCPAATPVCRADGQCIRCQGDPDCSVSVNGPVCDTTSGSCVQCTTDSQCSSPTARCDTSSHACVRCLTNADCGRESICNPTSHVCSPMF